MRSVGLGSSDRRRRLLRRGVNSSEGPPPVVMSRRPTGPKTSPHSIFPSQSTQRHTNNRSASFCELRGNPLGLSPKPFADAAFGARALCPSRRRLFYSKKNILYSFFCPSLFFSIRLFRRRFRVHPFAVRRGLKEGPVNFQLGNVRAEAPHFPFEPFDTRLMRAACQKKKS